MRTKQFTVVLVVLLVVVALAIGIFIGQQQGKKKTEDRLGALIDRAYPRPPAEMYSIGGIVINSYGAELKVEVIDPDDYLPYTDGTPQKTELRSAVISSKTEVARIDYTKPELDGDPTITEIPYDMVQIGDEVIVYSNENIRDAERFDATRIEVIEY